MVQVVDIDASLLRIAHENFWLDMDDVSAGPGLDGRDQVFFSENRRWIGRLDFVRMRSDALRNAVLVGDKLRGRANVLRIPLSNNWTVRFAGDVSAFYEKAGVTAEDENRGFIQFQDGTVFSDGSGFALPDYNEPTVVYNVLAGTSSIQLDGWLGRNIVPGAVFSINDFLYRVEDNVDGLVAFNPPLREAAAAGTQVDVSSPKIQVRLKTVSDWRPFREFFRHGSPMTVNVVEAFDR